MQRETYVANFKKLAEANDLSKLRSEIIDYLKICDDRAGRFADLLYIAKSQLENTLMIKNDVKKAQKIEVELINIESQKM